MQLAPSSKVPRVEGAVAASSTAAAAAGGTASSDSAAPSSAARAAAVPASTLTDDESPNDPSSLFNSRAPRLTTLTAIVTGMHDDATASPPLVGGAHPPLSVSSAAPPIAVQSSPSPGVMVSAGAHTPHHFATYSSGSGTPKRKRDDSSDSLVDLDAERSDEVDEAAWMPLQRDSSGGEAGGKFEEVEGNGQHPMTATTTTDSNIAARSSSASSSSSPPAPVPSFALSHSQAVATPNLGLLSGHASQSSQRALIGLQESQRIALLSPTSRQSVSASHSSPASVTHLSPAASLPGRPSVSLSSASVLGPPPKLPPRPLWLQEKIAAKATSTSSAPIARLLGPAPGVNPPLNQAMLSALPAYSSAAFAVAGSSPAVAPAANLIVPEESYFHAPSPQSKSKSIFRSGVTRLSPPSNMAVATVPSPSSASPITLALAASSLSVPQSSPGASSPFLVTSPLPVLPASAVVAPSAAPAAAATADSPVTVSSLRFDFHSPQTRLLHFSADNHSSNNAAADTAAAPTPQSPLSSSCCSSAAGTELLSCSSAEPMMDSSSAMGPVRKTSHAASLMSMGSDRHIEEEDDFCGGEDDVLRSPPSATMSHKRMQNLEQSPPTSSHSKAALRTSAIVGVSGGGGDMDEADEFEII